MSDGIIKCAKCERYHHIDVDCRTDGERVLDELIATEEYLDDDGSHMNTSGKHTTQAIDSMRALGDAWRGDWNDFDGRTLRDQLYDIEAVLRGSISKTEFLTKWQIEHDEHGFYKWAG